ncbi:MAG: hypothetical protein Q7R50_01675 [Dehalococcoidales bacterium]|nr:hypothetical protein [Dehalococcoidales bacterium]
MAAKIKRELNADVEMVHGRYGEFKVIVDGETIIDGGAKVILGIMPSAKEIIEAVRSHLPEANNEAG